MLTTVRHRVVTRTQDVAKAPTLVLPRPGLRFGPLRATAGRSAQSRDRDHVYNDKGVHRIRSHSLDAQRSAKLEKYLETWKDDVSSTGPLWNTFTAVMATGALVVIGLGIFAWLSYGVLWGISPGTRLY